MQRSKIKKIKRVICVVVIALFISEGSNWIYHQAEAEGKTEVSLEFEETQEEEETSKQSMSEEITLPGYETIKVTANETQANVNFYNPADNPCNLSITLTRNDTNDVIYESKLLAPGQHLYKIELNEAFDIGTYKTTLTYQTYSLEDNSPLNGAQMELDFIVGE